MNQPTFFSAARVLPLLAMLAVAIVWSCDSYEPDVTPQDQVSVGQSQFYTLPNSSAVIDLKTIVKSYSKVDLTIGKQPGNGNLTKLGAALYAYMPKADFNKGRDYFLLNVSRDGQTLQRDTIYIEVGQDTTQLPCGVYAVLDTVNIPTSGPASVRIHVLGNDRICGVDSTDLQVSLFSNPQHGTATLSGRSVVYTTPGYDGYDSFLYEIRSAADTAIHALGLVSLRLGNVAADTCELKLNNDVSQYNVNASSPLTVGLIVTANDSICHDDVAVSIVNGPLYGTASLGSTFGQVLYTKSSPFTESYSDSVRYQVCSGGVCKTAVFIMHFVFNDVCAVTARPDTVNLPLGITPAELSIAVLANDSICAGVQSLTILTAPKTGTATVQGNNSIFYQANSATSPTDSLKYQLCGTGGGCSAAWVKIRRN
jgi:hypothetical protein